MSVINDYRTALQRLIAGTPLIVPKGTKINNDTVALEAGRSRGSIKKSRAEFLPLINEIKVAVSGLSNNASDQKLQQANSKLDLVSRELSQLKQEHTALLAKYLSVLHYNYQLQQENKKLGGAEHLMTESIKLGTETF